MVQYTVQYTVLSKRITRLAWSRGSRGRVGGDAQPRPITSPDRPGLPDFSRGTLKNMGRARYEGRCLALALDKLPYSRKLRRIGDFAESCQI